MDAQQKYLWTTVAKCLFAALVLVAPGFGGCTKQKPQAQVSSAGAQPAPASDTPELVLQKMISAYHDAAGYGDRAIIELSYELNGEKHHDTASIAVRLSRPNRARIQVYQADVACDGQQLVARIKDEGSDNIDNQCLVQVAPANLSLKNLLDDPVLYDALSTGLGRLPIQLELLLGEAPLEGFLAAGAKRKLLEPERILDDRCCRVSVTTGEGEFVLWIDQEDFVLRRLEYPSTMLTSQIAGEQEPTDVRLVAEFDDARLVSRPAEASAFTMPIPDGARQVRYFVKPPQPLPSNLLGQKIPDFHFSQLDGQSWTNSQLSDKIAVLHWYVDHPACEASLRQWEQVRRQYADQPDVEFIAVCVEPSTVQSETIRELLRRWEVEATVVRDMDAAGRDVFAIGALPAVVVLDRQQVVQVFDVSFNPQLAEQLPEALDQLLDGHDIATQILAQVHNEIAQYYQTLAAAGSPANKTLPTSSTVAAHWIAEKLWDAPFHQPGNMTTMTLPDGGSRLLILEEGRVVLELDHSCRSSGTHRLPIPESDYITHLRATADGSGFVAFSLGGRRAYWLDSQWQLIQDVPEMDVRHEGMHDAIFFERENSVLLAIATAGTGGVRAITRAGKTVWQVEEPAVQSLSALDLAAPSDDGLTTPTAKDKQILIAADAAGRLLEFRSDGSQQELVDSRHVGIFHIWPIAGERKAQDAAYVGISYNAEGTRLAYGLDGAFEPLWEYRLPADPFRFPVEYVTTGPLTDGGAAYCVLASADGAIHLLSADGRDHDYFFTGAQISGLHLFTTAKGPALFIGGESSVTAWRLQPVARATVGENSKPSSIPASTELEPIESEPNEPN